MEEGVPYTRIDLDRREKKRKEEEEGREKRGRRCETSIALSATYNAARSARSFHGRAFCTAWHRPIARNYDGEADGNGGNGWKKERERKAKDVVRQKGVRGGRRGRRRSWRAKGRKGRKGGKKREEKENGARASGLSLGPRVPRHGLVSLSSVRGQRSSSSTSHLRVLNLPSVLPTPV